MHNILNIGCSLIFIELKIYNKTFSCEKILIPQKSFQYSPWEYPKYTTIIYTKLYINLIYV